jgi:hypothetical protein
MTVGLTATIKTEVEQQIELQDAQGIPVYRQMSPNVEETFQAGTSIGIQVPGVIHISVTSGSVEPAELSAQLAQHNTEAQEILTQYGSADESTLMVKREEWLGLEHEMIALRNEISVHAAPHANVLAVNDAVAEATRELTICCNQLDLTIDEARQLQVMDVDLLEASYKGADAEVEKQRNLQQERLKQYDKSREQENAKTNEKRVKELDVIKNAAEMRSALNSTGCRDYEELIALESRRAAVLQENTEVLAKITAQLPSPGAT